MALLTRRGVEPPSSNMMLYKKWKVVALQLVMWNLLGNLVITNNQINTLDNDGMKKYLYFRLQCEDAIWNKSIALISHRNTTSIEKKLLGYK